MRRFKLGLLFANNPHFSDTAANAEATALGALCNSGFLRIYDGTQPANANTAITTQNLLAELTFGSTAFGAAAAGLITANSITQDSSANNTGTASWFRCVESNGTTTVMDGSAGTSSADLDLNTTSIVTGAVVQCSAFTVQITE